MLGVRSNCRRMLITISPCPVSVKFPVTPTRAVLTHSDIPITSPCGSLAALTPSLCRSTHRCPGIEGNIVVDSAFSAIQNEFGVIPPADRRGRTGSSVRTPASGAARVAAASARAAWISFAAGSCFVAVGVGRDPDRAGGKREKARKKIGGEPVGGWGIGFVRFPFSWSARFPDLALLPFTPIPAEWFECASGARAGCGRRANLWREFRAERSPDDPFQSISGWEWAACSPSRPAGASREPPWKGISGHDGIPDRTGLPVLPAR
ncbi:hypothetical protein SAMN02982929_01462 [Saccharopolyspora kobensis]|uniref:Uncharacterized protein n=1 Tax=Saccharopolyspora kobensis TaxID=146035 RepID=A0A1H5XBG3_9PSEU|nr:hypothetical protein SAMN02982929_01462 [Saccharopolyspora kobensis]SFE45274.1 hypothetical protein SAMN05216506_111163 [Saccharopolyspora kobensis]